MKKIKLVLLFVAIASNNLFSQEVIYTHGAQILKFDDAGKSYFNSKVFNELDIFTIDKGFIKINCSDTKNRDTVYTIIKNCGEIVTMDGDTKGKSIKYICNDIDGGICWIYVSTEVAKNEKHTIEIQYSNSSIVYYVVK
jgi:hypothetical protein